MEIVRRWRGTFTGELSGFTSMNVLLQRLQRKLRRGEGEIFKERLAGRLRRVFLETLDGVIGD
jgi:hypothetical protein